MNFLSLSLHICTFWILKVPEYLVETTGYICHFGTLGESIMPVIRYSRNIRDILMTKNHEDIGHKSLFKAISFRLRVHETFEARYPVQDQSRSRAQMRKVSGLRIFPLSRHASATDGRITVSAAQRGNERKFLQLKYASPKKLELSPDSDTAGGKEIART
jgi:hypothetical protein